MSEGVYVTQEEYEFIKELDELRDDIMYFIVPDDLTKILLETNDILSKELKIAVEGLKSIRSNTTTELKVAKYIARNSLNKIKKEHKNDI